VKGSAISANNLTSLAQPANRRALMHGRLMTAVGPIRFRVLAAYYRQQADVCLRMAEEALSPYDEEWLRLPRVGRSWSGRPMHSGGRPERFRLAETGLPYPPVARPLMGRLLRSRGIGKPTGIAE
jgi:hypothetical protein